MAYSGTGSGLASSQEHGLVPIESLADLQSRCNTLLAEIDTFVKHIKSQKPTGHINPESRPFRTGVQSELKSINRLAKASSDDTDNERLAHALRSSNVPFFEAVWNTAKHSKGVVAFGKRFYWKQPTKETKLAAKAASNPIPDGGGNAKALQMRDSALVDIVADNGLHWIKVSTLTETRLGFEIAKQGWERDDSDDENTTSLVNDSISDYRNDDDVEDGLSILKIAEGLSKASKAHRIRYRHPKITLVMPKISRCRIEQVAQLIDDIERTGIEVQALEDMPQLEPADIEGALKSMAVDETSDMTKTLNVDCTILLALVSDLSHSEVGQEPWFHTATRKQIEVEEKESLLPSVLYPVMDGRELTCTTLAAKRMREIVETIATPTERRRAELLVSDSPDSVDKSSFLAEWSCISTHPLPTELRFPIRIVDETRLKPVDTPLPEFAQEVARELSELNNSVFMYGWRRAITTISSNRTVARQIEALIEDRQLLQEDDLRGPDVWLCSVSRSLIGKEKNRK